MGVSRQIESSLNVMSAISCAVADALARVCMYTIMEKQLLKFMRQIVRGGVGLSLIFHYILLTLKHTPFPQLFLVIPSDRSCQNRLPNPHIVRLLSQSDSLNHVSADVKTQVSFISYLNLVIKSWIVCSVQLLYL